MNSFSIAPYEHQPIIDTYKRWLVKDLYQNFYFDNLNAPDFLKKLSIVQAEGIRHDIALHAATTNLCLKESSSIISRKIQSAANIITSSLDDGFSLMNQRMAEMNSKLSSMEEGIGAVNENIIEGNRLKAQTNVEIQSLNRNMVVALSAINSNISQAAIILKYQLQQVTTVLQEILDELKIPEFQRERRYHIEEGIKFFNMGMKTGDCLYFDDSLDEFNSAITIERKDFLSWYYIGMIRLYSKNHVDIEKAISAFDSYFHYAAALPQKHELYNDAILLKAECYYIEQNFSGAYHLVSGLTSSDVRAALRGVKYLSASGVADSQIQAVDMLKGLMKENPYIIMQVLLDYDILSNDYIVSFLREYNNQTIHNILKILALLDKEMEVFKRFPISYYQDLNDEIKAIKENVNKKIKSIEIVDAIALKEELLNMGMRAKIKTVLELAQKETDEDAEKKRRLSEYNALKEKYKIEREYLKSHGFVDLGLPSGRLWKIENEREFYNISSAIHTFGNDYIPDEYGWEELFQKCKWSWEASLFKGGYRVTGPNGLSIFLPAKGTMCGNGQISNKNKSGDYLSSSMRKEWPWYADDDYCGDKEDHLRCLQFYKNYKSIVSCHVNSLHSLRLSFWRRT